MRRILLMMILFSSLVLAKQSPKALKVVCFVFSEQTEVEEICQLPTSQNIQLNNLTPLTQGLAEIQEHIRVQIGGNHKVVLVAEGFLGTLVSIAQTNMLPYYRKEIQGLVLKNVPINLYESCLKKPLKRESEHCHRVNTLYNTIGAFASKAEVFKALSVELQMDWYWPKVIITGEVYQEHWHKALSDNAVKYQKMNLVNSEKALNYFALTQSHKVQPKNNEIEPDFLAPLLRFHLNKVLYEAKNKIVLKENIAYAQEEKQVYDVYFREKSHNNPVILYVHGGGWTKGDKKAYDGFAMQYADRGYTVVNINYRLMQHPKVGMKEMVEDVKHAIEHSLDNLNTYRGDSNKVFLFAESAGGQLASVALSQLDTNKTISGAFFNSISTDLRLFSKAKQVRLSNIKEDTKRLAWLDTYSPINQLHQYRVPTLIAHSFDDQVVPLEHLERFELLSILHHGNIQAIWVEGASHPLAPHQRSLQPSYRDIENKFLEFLTEAMSSY